MAASFADDTYIISQLRMPMNISTHNLAFPDFTDRISLSPVKLAAITYSNRHTETVRT